MENWIRQTHSQIIYIWFSILCVNKYYYLMACMSSFKMSWLIGNEKGFDHSHDTNLDVVSVKYAKDPASLDEYFIKLGLMS